MLVQCWRGVGAMMIALVFHKCFLGRSWDPSLLVLHLLLSKKFMFNFMPLISCRHNAKILKARWTQGTSTPWTCAQPYHAAFASMYICFDSLIYAYAYVDDSCFELVFSLHNRQLCHLPTTILELSPFSLCY